MSGNQGQFAFLPGHQKPPHRIHGYTRQQGRPEGHSAPPLGQHSSTDKWSFDVSESVSGDTNIPRTEKHNIPSFSSDLPIHSSEREKDNTRHSVQKDTSGQGISTEDYIPSEQYQKNKKHRKKKSIHRKNSDKRRSQKSSDVVSGHPNEGFQNEEGTSQEPRLAAANILRSREKKSMSSSGQNSAFDNSATVRKKISGQAFSKVNTTVQRKSALSLLSQTSQSWHASRRQSLAMCAETRRNLNQNFTALFIYNNVLQRECSMYIKDDTSGSNKCQCGREAQWHREKGMDVMMETPNITWNASDHTARLPCDSFGEVLFRGFGIQSNKTSPYMRVDSECDMEIVWTVLTHCWQLPVPKLIISITGGAKRFNLRPRLKTILKQGLVNAAVTTGAWIITGGTATGVMEFVGEAVQDHVHSSSSSEENQCVALGVAPWGAIANNISLDGEGVHGLFPACYCREDIKTEGKKCAPLDHNHTHFLLVDDGSEGQFGLEIEFRSRLQSYISQKVETGVAESQSVNVPSVLIVVEGGINTMKTVRESITRKMPVVVIKGSGRAADFIAAAFHLTKTANDEDRSVYPLDFEETMFAKARVMFEWKEDMTIEDIDKNIYEALHYLEDCLEERKMLNIFNLDKADSEKDIDRAILYALLKANKSDANSQLALALAWNRCDIARREIFTSKNRHVWQQADLYNAMFTALVQNRADFVQLFLDNGVDLRLFLTTRTLWNLYCNCIVDPSDAAASLLRNLISSMKQTWAAFVLCRGTPDFENFPDLLPFINRLIVHLLQDKSLSFYIMESHTVKEEHPSMSWKGDLQKVQPRRARMMSLKSETGNEKTAHGKTKSKFEDDADFEHPERELFIWAVLFNRRELTHLFWRSGKDHLGGALFASALLYRLSRLAGDEEEAELCTDMALHSDECEQWAIKVLSECYSRDKQLTHRLLVRNLDHWGHFTLFRLADSYELMEFAEHSACQTKLSSIWKGRMALYTSQIKIFFCTFLPFLVPFIKFTVESKGLEVEDDIFEEQDLDGGSPLASPGRSPLNRVAPKALPDTDGDGLGFVQSRSRRGTHILAARLRKVNLFDFTTDNLNIVSAIYYFYEAPVTKFFSSLLAYILFMCLFSYVVLVKLAPADGDDSPSLEEYLTWAWVVTLVMEEIRQVLSAQQKSLKYKFRNWMANFWNCFDTVMYLLFILSIILRFVVTNERFVWARVAYSITLTMFFLRSMQYFYVEKNMGPKIIMIRRMLKDLVFFFLILLVFVISFGVSYHANLYPQSPPSFKILVNILYYPYFQMYGELFLEDMKAESGFDCTDNETIWREDIFKRCPTENAVVPLLLAVYMIITHILLINLLIAMFSYTFQAVQENSTQVWRYYRLSLVFEYSDRPALFPPLIFFSHVFRLIRWILYCTNLGSSKRQNILRMQFTPLEQVRLTLFEKNAVENHLSLSKQKSKYSLDSKVSTAATRLENVMEELERIKECLQPSETTRTSLSLPQQFNPYNSATGAGAASAAALSKLQKERELMDRPPVIKPSSTERSKPQQKDVVALNQKVDGVVAQTAFLSQRINQLTVLLEESLSSQRATTSTQSRIH